MEHHKDAASVIRYVAEQELAADRRRAAIDAEKARIVSRIGKPWLARLADRLPFIIVWRKKS